MRAIVTGASRGIGGATCMKLARDSIARGEPAKFVACATGMRPDLHELVDELNALGAEAIALTGDLADPDVPARLVDEAQEFCGGLDAVVSNAGYSTAGTLAELSIADWERMFATNLRPTWLLAKAAHQPLKASRGALVAVGSFAGVLPRAGGGAYAAAKAALIVLCQQLAQEWGQDGIRVNVVSPGMIHTPLSASIYADPVMARRRAEIVPLGRVGMPDDVASTIAFLLGGESAYVTGQNIIVDGGFAASILSHIPGVPAATKSTTPTG
jgi:NAD(P)-dependent dehydrogenase (short-subunit alcohol dehydrogenase family)